jgi:monoterpene epsilon-lactone hydrolase
MTAVGPFGDTWPAAGLQGLGLQPVDAPAADLQAIDSVIARVQATYARWRRDTPPQVMRDDWDALFAGPVDADIEALQIGACHAEWVVAPGSAAGGVLLYFHGGGFRLGSCRSHRELMAGLSAAAGCRVLGLDYRLAPEHRLPAQQQDAQAAWQWLIDQGESPQRIALGGDSAGAWLALGLLLHLRDSGAPQPAAAVTLSALTDLSASGESYDSRATADPVHQRPMIQAIGRTVLGAGDAPQDPRFSPLFANLHGLPPLLMQVGDRETVLSDTTLFAARARACGVEACDEVWPGMVHVFQQFPAELASARAARQRIGHFLRRHLAPTSAQGNPG